MSIEHEKDENETSSLSLTMKRSGLNSIHLDIIDADP